MAFTRWALLAFLLFLIYDLNMVLWRKKIFSPLFLTGCLIIAATTLTAIARNWENGRIFWGFCLLAFIFLILLLYTLFFALPFVDTYIKNEKKNRLCTTGLYALCRHPGVVWFILLYFFLVLAFPSKDLALLALTACTLNVLYAFFQDRWSFPRLFEGYDEYRKLTPFLIPRPQSIRKSFLGAAKKEGKL